MKLFHSQESELYGLLATAKSLQIKGLTDSEDNGGNEQAKPASSSQPAKPAPSRPAPPPVMSPTMIVAPSTAGAATAAPVASSVLKTNTLVLKPKLPPLNNTPTVKLARGNPLVTVSNPGKRPAAAPTVTGIEQPGGDPAKRVKEEQGGNKTA